MTLRFSFYYYINSNAIRDRKNSSYYYIQKIQKIVTVEITYYIRVSTASEGYIIYAQVRQNGIGQYPFFL